VVELLAELDCLLPFRRLLGCEGCPTGVDNSCTSLFWLLRGNEWQDEDLLLWLSESDSEESEDPELLSEESELELDPELLPLPESES